MGAAAKNFEEREGSEQAFFKNNPKYVPLKSAMGHPK